jgi:hypothetical protein
MPRFRLTRCLLVPLSLLYSHAAMTSDSVDTLYFPTHEQSSLDSSIAFQQPMSPERPSELHGGLPEQLAIENERWSDQFAVPRGCDGSVVAFAVAPDGHVYMGGGFRACEGVEANGVVRYHPETDTWSALGHDGGNGVDGGVRALILADDVLYVGGIFTEANVGAAIPAGNIARFDLQAQQWSALTSEADNGTVGPVLALATDPAGTLYVGGDFSEVHPAQPVTANGLARWDPVTGAWSALTGDGEPQGDLDIWSLHWHQNKLYIGTQFSVYSWNPQDSWSELGPGRVGGAVFSMAANGSHLYVGGNWEEIYPGDGTTVQSGGIARWSFDDQRWEGVDGGVLLDFFTPPSVFSLLLDGDRLYVGGRFFQSAGASPVTANGLLTWSLLGDGWDTVDGLQSGGATGTVYALAVAAERVFIGGFISGGVVPGQSLRSEGFAIWRSDLQQWQSSSAGDGQGITRFYVSSITELDGQLYALGEFHGAGDVAVNALARWNGSQWQPVGTPQNNGGVYLSELHAFQGRLYVTGYFGEGSGPGPIGGHHLVSWDPVSGEWEAIGQINADPDVGFEWVYAMASVGDDLYVGGVFASVSHAEGTTAANNLARWNHVTRQWSSMGSDGGDGTSLYVNALHPVGTDLYVGGSFSQVNIGTSPIMVNNIARWDGENWHALETSGGVGSSGAVYALTSDAEHLYAGGRFLSVDGGQTTALRVARWRLAGGGWEGMGNGIGPLTQPGNDDAVGSLESIGDWIYAAGLFSAVENDSIAANSIARWPKAGGPWRPLGTGIERRRSSVSDLTAAGEDLYVGGGFSLAGRHSSRNIARYATRGALDLTISGSGGGRVSSEPSGIDCSSSCSARFEWDQTITLTAQAFASSSFAGWTGDCSGTTLCVVDFDRARFVGANFETQADLFANDFE